MPKATSTSSSSKKRSHNDKESKKSSSEGTESPAKKKKVSSGGANVDSFKSGSYKGVNGTYVYDGTVLDNDEDVRTRDGYTDQPMPKLDAKTGVLQFEDAPEFRPNLSPKEVLQAGSFGGTYFRPIKSAVTGLKYDKMWLELPQNWLQGLNVKKTIASSIYDQGVNTYKVKCGGSLEMWESSGWIEAVDPYGWFMWYTRFYLGRRTTDDQRQIGRWKNCAGEKGRWKNNLIGKVARAGAAYDNKAISPVVRQTLQHWGYRLTQKDYDLGKKRVKM